nr:MAG TPA: hypothetical protein [Caudoviricetes sp.]
MIISISISENIRILASNSVSFTFKSINFKTTYFWIKPYS